MAFIGCYSPHVTSNTNSSIPLGSALLGCLYHGTRGWTICSIPPPTALLPAGREQTPNLKETATFSINQAVFFLGCVELAGLTFTHASLLDTLLLETAEKLCMHPCFSLQYHAIRCRKSMLNPTPIQKLNLLLRI